MIVNKEEGVNPERSPADMVLFNCFGDERWYIAYLSDMALGEGWLAVTVYSIEDGKHVPCTYGLSPEHQCSRLALPF
jgi:hypothetical protein